MPLWENPEFIRNCRAQLRPRRMLTGLLVVAALSLVVGYSMHESHENSGEWAKALMIMGLGAQLAVLGLAGGMACALAIYREKENNTFDFQRVTRLTPLEVTVGKLFGAPIFCYFLTACLMPVALVGGIFARIPATHLVTGLVIILLGSIVFHALALLMSLLSPRGGTGVPGALLLLFLPVLVLPAMNQSTLKTAGPWAGVLFAAEGSWQTRSAVDSAGLPYATSDWTDLVFGWPVHHVPVLLTLYLTLLGWLLLALVRNMKRDPGDFELYSPEESVGLLCYFNLLVLAFYVPREWVQYQGAPIAAQRNTVFQIFLGLNIALLYFLGATLLRSREQSRRRVYDLDAAGPGWRGAVWPAGYVLTAAGCVAVLVCTRFALSSMLRGKLDPGVAAFQVVFLLAAVLRDLFYFQWMKLRRLRYPLAMGFVFLSVFYACSLILLNTMPWIGEGKQPVLMAIPIPWVAIFLDQTTLASQAAGWSIALGAQLALCALFAWLHYRKLAELAPVRGGGQSAPAAAAAPSGM